MQDKIIEVIGLEEILKEIIDKIVEEATEVKEITVMIGKGIGQEREPLQETIGEIEVLVLIDLDQGPEQVQIGIG